MAHGPLRAPLSRGLLLGAAMTTACLQATACGHSSTEPSAQPSAQPTARPAEDLVVCWSGGTTGVEQDLEYISDLGLFTAETNAFWGAPSPDGIETTRGQYDFSNLDRVVGRLTAAGVSEISLAVFPENTLYGVRGGLFTSEEQWLAFGSFLEALVVRFPQVSSYQIVRELNRERFAATAQGYARLLELSSRIIRRERPGAAVVFGALPYDLRIQDGREDFLAEVIEELPAGERHFDAVDIHCHLGLTRANGAAGVDAAFRFYASQLSGIYEDSEITFETSVYTGAPPGLPRQSEQDQADDLTARLSVLGGLGVHRVNLEGGLYQRPYFLFVNGEPAGHLEYFEHAGLVWNCEVDADTDGSACRSGESKRAYHALQDWMRGSR